MNLADSIRKIAEDESEVYSVICRVNLIDEASRTCDVSPLNGDAKIFGVRLQADLEGEKGLTVYPTKGSNVVVTFINKETGYVALCSDIEKFEFKIGGKSLEFDADGLRIAGEQSDLLTEILALTKQMAGIYDFLLSQYNLNTPVGPTLGVIPAVPPLVVQKKAAITQIEQKIKTILR